MNFLGGGHFLVVDLPVFLGIELGRNRSRSWFRIDENNFYIFLFMDVHAIIYSDV